MDYSRRSYLKTAGCVASGFLVGTHDLNGGWFARRSKSNDKEVVGIPKQWIDLEGKIVYEYANYIVTLNLKNITPRMVIAPHFKTRGRIRNCIPPKSLWEKIKPTLEVIDVMAGQMGAPVREILSAYRSPTYNKAVRGKSRSYHMQNQAIDVMFKGTSPWHVAKVARHLRDKEKEFKGGIGRYGGFVHIDTRGENFNW